MVVYPQLDALLRERQMSVAELVRQVEACFGLSVDPKTLYRLASSEPVQRADLNIAGAVASLLGVGLDDLFDVHAVRVDVDEADMAVLDAKSSARLSELFDRKARGMLAVIEQAELESLVAEYGRLLHQQRMREFAGIRGISIEQAEREADADLNRALTWWQEFESDPSNRDRLAARILGDQTDITA